MSPLRTRTGRGDFPWYVRVVLAVCGLSLVGLLVTAANLSPDPSGLGTHHQLGLHPCLMRQVVGIRCPSCGMTTSWAHMTRGNVVAAFKANCGGALLALMAAIGGPALVVSAVLGRGWPLVPNITWVATLLAIVLGVTLLDWSYRLWGG